MDEKALRLISEANAVLARADRGAAFHNDANRKAVELAEFLQTYGEALDANGQGWLVDAIGAKVDDLVSGARDTLDSVMESPLDAATESLKQDAATALKFGFPIAAGVLLLVVLVMLRR